jgi:general secretion pathway protein G
MKLNPYSKHRLNLTRPRTRAFTLVEMLLVLVILGTLAAIVVPAMMNRAEEARVKTTIAQISALRTALTTFEMDNGRFPSNRNGLQELVQRPGDAPDWRGPYLDPPYLPKDGWHREFAYECPGRNNPTSYDLSSSGRDGIFGTEDDIVSWRPNN